MKLNNKEWKCLKALNIMGVPLSTVSSKYIKPKNVESEGEGATTKTQLSVLLVVLYLYSFRRLIVCVVIHPHTAFHWAVCSDIYQVTRVQGTVFGERNWRHNLWRVPQCHCPIFINTWNCTSAKQVYHLCHLLCIENTEEHLHVVSKTQKVLLLPIKHKPLFLWNVLILILNATVKLTQAMNHISSVPATKLCSVALEVSNKCRQ